MADNNESTMRWKVDITQLKAAMQDAKRSISIANAEFKTATAGMDKWSKSSEGLEAKIKQLNSTLPQQKTILSQLEKQYEITAKNMGENSEAAQDLKIKIEEQKASIVKTETSINTYTQKLEEMQAAENSLSNVISKQEAELKNLKEAYINTAAQYGENSDEAKKLADQISNLSGELVDNKKKQAEAKSAADKLDKSLDDVGKSAKKTNADVKDLDGGFTVLKGVMSNLAADAIKGLISGFKNLASTAVDTVFEISSAGDEIDKSSQKLGISAENYQKLSYAMERCGADVEDFKKGTINISKELANVQAGTKGAGKSFDDLGVSLKNADGSMRSTEDVLLDTIDALADMDDETKRNALANEVFGKSYQELAPLLNSGSKEIKNLMQEAEDYGMVMSNEAVASSAAFEDSLTRLKSTVNGVKARLVEKLLPSLSLIADGFSDMASGSDTSGKKITRGLEGLKRNVLKILKSLMPEASKTVFPVLNDLYKTLKTIVEFIVKNFSTIAPIVTTAVAAFAALNAAMAITKTITAVSAAISGLEVGVGLATKAQVVWNAALTANPIGAVITAVAALTAAVVLLASKQSDAEKAHKAEMDALQEQRDEIDANVDSWNSLKEAQQKQIDAGMTEMSYYDSLKKELQSITDENGKVKKGYEDRASFITTQLSDATGVEIELIDGVIQKYGEVIQSIDDLMEKKKAQIILDSQESLYKEAINNQADALKNLNAMQDERTAKQQEIQALEEEYAIRSQELLNSKNWVDQTWYADEMGRIQNRIDAKKEELATVEASYDEQESLLSEYAYNIGQYEQNMQLAHEGNYAEMSTVSWNYVKDYQSANDAQKKILEEQIRAEETNLDLLKKLKSSGHTNIYDQQIKQSEERLAQQKKELLKYKDATKAGVDEVTVEWKEGLDEQLSELTGSQVEFKDAGDGQVQMYADGIKVGEPKATDEMAKLVTNTINEISTQYTGAKNAGEYLIDGVNSGIANESKQNSVFGTISNFGKKLLANLKASLKEQSPSKATDEMGQYLIEGLSIGISKKEKSLLKQVSSVGGNVLDYFSSSMGIADKAFEKGMKDSKNIVENGMNSYFNSLISANKQELDKAQKQLKNTNNKAQKKRLQEKIASLKKEKTELTKMYKNFSTDVMKKYQSAVESATNGISKELSAELKELADQVDKAISSMQSKLVNYGSLFTKGSSGLMRLTDISKQTEQIKRYGEQLDKLKGKISADLMQEIVGMDVADANQYMTLLLKMSDKELSEYDALYSEKVQAAKSVSNNFYADEVKALEDNYTKKIKQAFKDAKKEITKIGEETIKGFMKGMKSIDTSKSIKSITNSIIKAMKKQLKINSPSKVFEELGEFSGDGYVIGLASSLNDLKDVVASDIAGLSGQNLSGGNTVSTQQVVNFNQTINSPKAVDGMTLYQQTNSLLFSAKVRLGDV